ncbi:AfsR/SARP family transcriptional regulator [Geobacter pickeringii]|uniref:DNA-binding protein n=1 Tax=Geobacter pickeringii TaxID=345632 RepID=A0A0B5B8Y4_9BACT|nr:DNA-binding protein [Geobacter pickeringii]AJE03178.1 DNA-binding protein [Geobacter pickeringii]
MRLRNEKPVNDRTSSGREGIGIKTFGGLALTYQGSPVSIIWESQKARILFCYLLISYDQWLHRDKLIEMIWPGCDMVAGAKNFKTTLSRLRKSFSGARTVNPVLTLGEAIRLDFNLFQLDSSQFKYHAAHGIKMLARGEISAARKYLEAAQDIYVSEFLPEEPFDAVISVERAELEKLYGSVLFSLQKVYHLEGNHDAVEAISLLTPPVSASAS